jgi:hypothetical protein
MKKTEAAEIVCKREGHPIWRSKYAAAMMTLK